MLSACAGTGLYGPQPNDTALSNPQSTPPFVQNLPKSKTGNMEQYTVFGKQYKVMDSAANFKEQGTASWYGQKFHGRKTSSGEIYDMHAMTAAHKHLPLPTFVRVTNLENNQSVVVKVNDRGPFVGDRIIDMSFAAAQLLGMVQKGTAPVLVEGLSTHHVAQNNPAPPAVVEAQVAAVPIGPAIKSTEQAAQNVVEIDGTEDGFAEAPQLGAASVATLEDLQNNQQLGVAASPYTDEGVASGANNGPGNTVYIQLGAFASAANAHAMVDDVDEQTGLPAYVERDGDGRLYRVKMGPFQSGQLLENTLESLASIGIDSYTKMAKQF